MKALKEELEALGAFVLYHGKENRGWLLSFERNKFRKRTNPDRVVKDLFDLIKRLSDKGMKSWGRARARIFDIGFEMPIRANASHPRILESLSKESMKRIIALDASLVFTCYGRMDDRKQTAVAR